MLHRAVLDHMQEMATQYGNTTLGAAIGEVCRFCSQKNEAPVCISNKAMCGDKLKVMMVVVVVVMVALGTMRVEPVD